LFFIKFITLVFIGNNFYFNSVEIVTLTYNLRFNGFDNEWESFKLTEISERITRKNKSLETDRPLTISAQYGLVDQIEFFNKIVASKSLKGYYLLKNGEFAYNKSYSNGYPFGAVKRLDKYENGAISTLYICFKVNDKMNSDLMKEYFETDKWYKEIYKIAVKGARNHGLLNIAVGDFFNTKHILPTNRDEQEKIANFLIEINKKIDLLENKLLNYQNFKKYLMQQIFAQKLRFNFTDEWKKSKLKEICNVQDGTHTTPNYVDEGIPFYSVENLTSNVPPKFISKEEHEKLIKRCKPKFGDILITRIGTLAKSKVIDWEEEFSIYVSLALLSSIKINARFLNYYIQTDKYQKDFLKKSLLLAVPQKINLKDLNETIVEYPSSKEQEKIVNVFDSIDTKIAHINIELNNTKNFKRGLLQQMFI